MKQMMNLSHRSKTMKKHNTKNKKAQAFEVLIKALIVIAVAVILLFLFRNFFTKEKETGEQHIAGLTGDWDNDGIKDILDKCPCDPGEDTPCKTPANECTDKLKQEREI